MNKNIGISDTCRMLFKLMSDDNRNSLDLFCSGCSERYYEKFASLDKAFVSVTIPRFNASDSEAISHYSGFSYFSLNSAVKGTWNYEENGSIERYNEYKKYAEDLSCVIENNQASIGNVRVYRGVPLKHFFEYGIKSLDDLEMLKGQFLLDQGFVSTSLVEDECFYRKKPNNGIDYNVMIEYLVPEEFTDGVCIVNESHYVGEAEYLINTWNLAEVRDVRKDGDNGAIIQALLVPKKVYDDYYQREDSVVK